MITWDYINRNRKTPHDKTNKMTMRSAKTQISLGIRPGWSESSLCAQWVAKDPSFLHADSEDSDQTGRMPRLIWVFAGRTATLVVLSWGGSFYDLKMNWAYIMKYKIEHSILSLLLFTVWPSLSFCFPCASVYVCVCVCVCVCVRACVCVYVCV